MKSFPIKLIFFLGSLLFSSHIIWSQTPISVKTNDFVTTTIFFPSTIKKVVQPAANFSFSYESGSNIGLLKGRKGRASNLLVITEQGYIYSFALSYAEEVPEFSFILTTDQAISKTMSGNGESSKRPEIVEQSSGNDSQETVETNEIPIENVTANNQRKNKVSEALTTNVSERQKDTIVQEPVYMSNDDTEEKDLYDVDREEYYRIFCENNYLQKTVFKRSFRQNKKIAVRLNNILVDRNEKYFVVQIENNSKRKYDIAGLSFFKKAKVGQLEKIMNPLYTFNLQESIDPEGINEVVYVFKNFNISAKEKISVVLADANSDNLVILPLDYLLINSPSN
ncbi:DUF4138 domain-containing protein [Zobellia sp. B3R18]|uniref:DUF4138 domain-containing protein n=1 Tax=Zobellia sp. B3R18 TaxID=2841568 RepID=UPI001C06A35D|nr:DUF4138 domain-containing protein [Zobellia sp. B3R18]MBU2976035.1 DUF4138 domain-containing protein [Zobellia sp. B3R18]